MFLLGKNVFLSILLILILFVWKEYLLDFVVVLRRFTYETTLVQLNLLPSLQSLEKRFSCSQTNTHLRRFITVILCVITEKRYFLIILPFCLIRSKIFTYLNSQNLRTIWRYFGFCAPRPRIVLFCVLMLLKTPRQKIAILIWRRLIIPS